MNKVVLIFLIGVGGVFFYWKVPALAQLRPMSVEQLSEQADKIVEGVVTNIRCEMEANSRFIYSWVTLRIEKCLKSSDADAEVEFRIPGGVVDDLQLTVSHAPTFFVGEHVIVFLARQHKVWQVLGWRQGKFTIVKEQVLEAKSSLRDFETRILKILHKPLLSPQQDLQGALLVQPCTKRLQNSDHLLTISPQVSTPTFSKTADWQDIFSDDFEDVFPGENWSVGDVDSTVNGEHFWGKTDYLAKSGNFSVWCAKDGADSLDPASSNYPDNLRTWMVYGPFSLSDALAAELTFYLWLRTYSGDDYFFYGLSVDGHWFSGYKTITTNTGGWRPIRLAFADSLLGEPQVWLGMLFESDGSGNARGVFVDKLVLRKNVITPDTPVIHRIEPDTAAAGIGAIVTIYGEKFGVAQGSSQVKFYSPEGEAAATILFWSNTEIRCEVPAGVSSGPVHIFHENGNVSNGYQFYVSFSFSGLRWSGEHPMGEPFYVYENPPGGISGALEAILAAANTWNSVYGSRFHFEYGGSTTASAPYYDNQNVIRWNESIGDSSVIAYVSTWFNSQTKVIAECDLVFNGSLNWLASEQGVPGTYDVQNVATHEMGHFYCFGDLYGDADSEKTMYGYVTNKGEIKKRSLSWAEEMGVRYIYGEPELTIGVLQHPVFTENVDIYVVGDYELDATSVWAAFQFHDQNQTLNLNALDEQNRIFVDNSFTFSDTGSARIIALARRKNLFITGRDTLNLQMTLIPHTALSRVTTKDQQACLSLAPETFSQDVLLMATNFSANKANRLPGIMRLSAERETSLPGNIYQFGDIELKLQRPAKLELRYDLPMVNGLDEKNLLILHWDGVCWRSVGGWVDRERNTVATVVQRLGYFCLGYDVNKRSTANPQMPVSFTLKQNFPNPLYLKRNKVTTIQYTLPWETSVAIVVYDLLGRKVCTLVNASQLPGWYTITWDGRNDAGVTVASGIYFYRLQTPQFCTTRKIVVIQ
ncbi:hypothetical protein DRQ00_06725 [candidate division KSB1 bacterium]|nr:MAG: hypothetical protein DRQ00_06725 [candidate division KSB1 bacterium]